MWNCRWLLCLVVIGLATREVYPMNGEQSRSKNDSQTTDSGSSLPLKSIREGKKKAHDKHTIRERDQVPSPSPEIGAGSTTSNGTVALVADGSATTSANATAKLSHSKRHFHRSKLYRKESGTKSRGSVKNNAASGSLIPFSTGHSRVPSLDLLNNSEHYNDGIKPVESTPRTSGTSHNNSFATNSSRMTAGSGNWDNSSMSSDSGSIVDEKASSVELMAFTFENVEEGHHSTLPNDLEKRLQILTQSSGFIAVDHSSSTTLMTPSLNRSVDQSKSTAADLASDRIERGQSVQTAKSSYDYETIISSVQTRKHRDTERKTNESSTSTRTDGGIAKDDSGEASSLRFMIPIFVASESSASYKSRNGSSPERGSDNGSNATNFGSNNNNSRPNADGYSWVSIDDSLNRISLNEVADTLKNIAFRESRGFYSYSNSTASNDSDRPDSPEHSRFRTPGPGIDQHTRESRPSMSSEPELKLANHSHASPPVIKFDQPLKLTLPLNLEATVKSRMKNDSVAEDAGLSKPSTSGDSSPKIEPSKLTSECSSSSSTEKPSHVRRRNDENSFHQRRIGDVTLAVRGDSVSETEQCLTTEAILSPVIPSSPGGNKVDVAAILANQSHNTREGEEDRGGQSLLSPGIIVLESFEPVLLESLASEESVVPVDDETTRSGHFFAALPDLEEHCNASSFNVFIPSINSRETVVEKEEPSLQNRSLNRTSTEESIYIMEGFGFFKDNIDDVAEIDADLDRRRDAPFDYPETEVYPGYPQVDDHPPPSPIKLNIDRIDFEADLTEKREPLLRRDGNAGDQSYDPWWFNDGSQRRGGQAMKRDDFDQRTMLIVSGFTTSKEVPVVHSSADDIAPESIDSKYYNHLFVGICVVVIGCSIWCSRLPVKRETNLPKSTYFIQERQRAAETV